MAKNDNIQDLLHDVAAAIRKKKGTTDLINPQDFSSEIASIESGGEVYTFGETMVDDGSGHTAIKNLQIYKKKENAIKHGAYRGFSYIESVNIHEGITAIYNDAFSGCSKLTSINIPDGVTYIGGFVFNGNTSLEFISLPNSVVTLGNGVFYGCTKLSSGITFGQSISSIGTEVFMNCNNIPFFDFSECSAIPTLAGISAFKNTSGAIVVPDALYDEWIAATNWSTYADRIVKASEYNQNNE